MRRIALTVGLIAVLLIAGCTSSDPEKTIAQVNGEGITQQEYDHRIKLVTASYKLELQATGPEQADGAELVIDEETLPLIQEAAFNQLVMMKLVAHEAKARGIELGQEEIDQYLDDFKGMQESFYGPDAYEQVLKDFAINTEELKQELALGLLRGKLEEEIVAEAEVTEDVAQEFYQENLESYTEAEGIKVSHILVDEEEMARDIIKELQAGADFASLASQHSTCPSKAQGGDLGAVNAESPLVEEFKQAALLLAVGEITSEPVKSEFGYHIIKATGQQEAGIRPFAEVKTEITRQLQENALETYLDGLYQQADIKDLRKK